MFVCVCVCMCMCASMYICMCMCTCVSVCMGEYKSVCMSGCGRSVCVSECESACVILRMGENGEGCEWSPVEGWKGFG